MALFTACLGSYQIESVKKIYAPSFAAAYSAFAGQRILPAECFNSSLKQNEMLMLYHNKKEKSKYQQMLDNGFLTVRT